MTVILVVEDDPGIGQAIVQLLRDAAYWPVWVSTAEEGLARALELEPDLILLDVMVPAMGGWELCEKLREHTAVPIIFLTALTDTAEIVHGLQLGADDYITKPFNQAEVIARISAHLRRHHKGQPTPKQVFGGGEIQINLDKHRIIVRQQPIQLTPREFSLLAVLVRNAGKVLTADELITQAWGEEYTDMRTNLKPYIHYLRKKIEIDPADPRWILTIRGIGYRFNDEV
jgi:DNA-binding response OmpR family regulator